MEAANQVDYEKIEIFGQEALFTCLRLDRSTVPDSLHAYDLREGDEGYPCEVQPFVMVNHCGTVLCHNPIEMEAGGNARVLCPDDYNFLGCHCTLDEFLAKEENRMIREIEPAELRSMMGKEGLILQGCGGDPQEWLDGLNEMLQNAGILQGGRFETCSVFQHGGCTCILFPFDNLEQKLHVGKLAVWRLQTHEMFGGTWLSDFVDNRLGGFLKQKQKPECRLIGEDGNIFHLMGVAAKTLRENGQQKQAKEMQARIMESGSYHEALGIMMEYVNITGEDAPEEGLVME